MPKVLLYIVFLICYLCWMMASFFSLNKVKSDLLAGKWFWSSELEHFRNYCRQSMQ